MNRYRILFLCMHNSARSQMAESFLNKLGDDNIEAMSAGLEPGVLNPYAVEVMKEAGIDISMNKTKGINDIIEKVGTLTHVITVCDVETAERCPVFSGNYARLHWDFPDPGKFEGNSEKILARMRALRDDIETRVKSLLKSLAK